MSPEDISPNPPRGETRSRLLFATGLVIADNGVAAVTMSRVAAEAGLSPNAAYKHFSNRDALLGAWEAELWEGIIARLGERVADRLEEDASTANRFFRVARASLDEISRTALQYRFTPGEMILLAKPPERMAHGLRAAELLEAALFARRDEVLPRNLRLASRLVVAACATLPFGWATDRGDELDSGAFQDELAILFTRYLLRDPALRDLPPPIGEDLRHARPVKRRVDAPMGRRRAWHRQTGGVDAKEPRRLPRQERSVETVAILLEATRQILLREGASAITTKSVAAKAGVSVGTVYQYFPTREAILAACEEQTLASLLTALASAVATGLARIESEGPLGDRGTYALFRPVIDELVASGYAHRLMATDMDLAARADERVHLAERAADFLSAALRHRADNVFPRNTRRAAMLVISTAVVLAFVWPTYGPADIASGEFQHELTTMLTRYVAAKLSQEPYDAPPSAADPLERVRRPRSSGL